MVSPPLSPEIQRGIAALRARLGDGAGLLAQAGARPDELASFDFPLPPDFLGEERTLQLGFTAAFPRMPLRVRIVPNAWLVWPHVMKNSVCLFGDGRPLNASPEDAIKLVMERVATLVGLSAANTPPSQRKAEFECEVATYWAQQLEWGPTQAVLLQLPNADGELLTLSDPRPRAQGTPSTMWLSPDKAALINLARRVGSPSGHIRQPASGAYFQRLSAVPAVQMPQASELLSWLETCCADLGAGITNWLDSTITLPERHLILALPAHDGARDYFALTLRSRALMKKASPAYGKRAGRNCQPGRRSTMDLALVRSLLQVLSSESIHSRNAKTAAGLADKHVVMVGAGSLGSQVASQLARAGVGRLSLVDPDSLNAENLGRHVLGMDDLGRPKVHALRDRLMKDVPSVDVESIATFVELEGPTLQRVFESADLVVVSTADWSSELWLWHKKRDGAAWPLLQVWSEPHGVAGHVLVVPADVDIVDGAKLFDPSGRFLHASTSGWPNDGFVDRPQCGGRFIPAGPIGLVAVASLASRVATEVLEGAVQRPQWHVYQAAEASVKRAGGVLTGSAPAPASGAVFEERAWPLSSADLPS